LDRSALANGLISIEQLLLAVDEARRKRVAYLESAVHSLHFLFCEFASAHTVKDSIVLVHNVSPFFLCSWYTRHCGPPKGEVRRMKKQGRPKKATGLTAELTNMLVSIRGRIGGAD
jgi:hypothetical protein